MEVYNPESNQKKKYQNDNENRSFFPRSELNDWMPFWEKLCFFLLGFLGVKLFSLLLQYIFMATPLIKVSNGVYTITTLGSVLLNFLTYLLLVLAFLGFIFLDRRKTYQRIFKAFKEGDTYLWALIGFGLVYGSQSLLSLLFSLIPFYGSNDNQSAIVSYTQTYPVMMFTVTVFFAPFCEELTYRIGLVDTIGHKYRLRWLGIVLSAVIFGLIHTNLISTYENLMEVMARENATQASIDEARYAYYNEWINLPIYIVSGFCLALTYAKSGKIASSMLSHLGVNLVSMISIFILMGQQSTTTSTHLLFL